MVAILWSNAVIKEIFVKLFQSNQKVLNTESVQFCLQLKFCVDLHNLHKWNFTLIQTFYFQDSRDSFTGNSGDGYPGYPSGHPGGPPGHPPHSSYNNYPPGAGPGQGPQHHPGDYILLIFILFAWL